MDKVGNRTSRSEGTLSETYGYTLNTNLLASVGSTAVTTDAAGNTTAFGNRTMIYNQANRLAEVRENGVAIGTYTTSANGRRIKKVAGGQTTIFHYDLAGKLIAESDGQGTFTRLYVYLDGAPLVQIDLSGTAETTSYYHTDHLGTPQKLTDETGTIVWAADYLPFGEVNITVATVENELRFAGQYFDAETGLHYNYHRYYDPMIGRYLTADPIGLDGGISLFAYVKNNPVNLIDRWGLHALTNPSSLLGHAGRTNPSAFPGYKPKPPQNAITDWVSNPAHPGALLTTATNAARAIKSPNPYAPLIVGGATLVGQCTCCHIALIVISKPKKIK